MAQQRLLERLQRLDAGERVDSAGVADLEVHSIMDHLRRLLTTRQGTVLIAEAYGLPDVFYTSGVSYEASSRRIQESIAEVIRRFEPRLLGVTVAISADRNQPLQQCLQVNAQLASDPGTRVSLSIEVSTEGKVSVRS
jgi:type VI secretion system protein